MPQRKTSTVQVDSTEVQGEGSWVRVRRLTWGEIKALSRRQEAIKEDQEQAIEVTDELLAEHALAWNWVDDDGAPLPQPKGNVGIIDQLTDEEFSFLADAITGNERERKN